MSQFTSFADDQPVAAQPTLAQPTLAQPTLAYVIEVGEIQAGLVARRAGEYALVRPGREMLFTVLPAEDKYKAKNFIDTVVYRGGDALSGWVKRALDVIGEHPQLAIDGAHDLPHAAIVRFADRLDPQQQGLALLQDGLDLVALPQAVQELPGR